MVDRGRHDWRGRPISVRLTPPVLLADSDKGTPVYLLLVNKAAIARNRCAAVESESDRRTPSSAAAAQVPQMFFGGF